MLMLRYLLLLCLLCTSVCAEDTITLLKVAPKKLPLGKFLVAQIVIRNNTDKALDNVILLEKIPPGLEYRGRNKGFSLRWKILSIPAQRQVHYTYYVKPLELRVFKIETSVLVDGKQVKHREIETEVVSEDKVKPIMDEEGTTVN